MQIVAILPLIVGVAVIEGQSVSASVEGGDSVVALPVLVTAVVVRKEAGKLVRTLETGVLCGGSG